MRPFGVSILTLLMIIAVGYFLGTMYPGVGTNLLQKVGLKQ
jgi:hypothetical protein